MRKLNIDVNPVNLLGGNKMQAGVVTVTLNPAIDKTVTLSGLEVGGLNRVREIRIDPGGKGINVAKVLKQFQVQVIAAGLVAGIQGGQLVKSLETAGIEISFVDVPGETRTNLKIVDSQTNITTEINEPGFTVGEGDLIKFQQQLAELLTAAGIVVIGGSLPPGAPTHIYRDYVELANSKGVRAILDADGEALKAGIKAKPFAIKPNIHELEQLVGRKLADIPNVIAAGRELQSQGISLVVISMGSQGAIFLGEQEVYQVTPFPISPQSTVGAGDSMVAALVYSLLDNKSLAETAAWATTAGTVTASKPGTQVCALPEVQQHLAQVKVIKV